MRLTVEFSPFIESLLFREPLCYFRLANTQIFFIFFFCSRLVKGFYSCTLSLDLYYSGLFSLFNEQIELELSVWFYPLWMTSEPTIFELGARIVSIEAIFFLLETVSKRDFIPVKKNISKGGDIIGVDRHKFMIIKVTFILINMFICIEWPFN